MFVVIMLPQLYYLILYAKYNNKLSVIGVVLMNKQNNADTTIMPYLPQSPHPAYIYNFSNNVVLCARCVVYGPRGQANMDIAGSVDDLHARLAITEASE